MANDQLDRIEWLALCTSRERAMIRRHADVVDLPAGATVLRQGESARWFYAVIEGSADVSIDGDVVGRVRAGEPVNELEVLRNELSPATVTAASQLRLLVMGRREFLGMLDEVPGLARRLLLPHIPTMPAATKRRRGLVPVPAA